MKIEVRNNYQNAEKSLEFAGEKKSKEDWVKKYVCNLVALGDIVSKQNGVVHIDFIDTESELEYYPDVKLTGFSDTAIELINWIAMPPWCNNHVVTTVLMDCP